MTNLLNQYLAEAYESVEEGNQGRTEEIKERYVHLGSIQEIEL